MRAQVSRVRRVRKCLIAGVAIFTVKDGNKINKFLKTTRWNWQKSCSHCILIIKNFSNKDLRVSRYVARSILCDQVCSLIE